MLVKDRIETEGKKIFAHLELRTNHPIQLNALALIIVCKTNLASEYLPFPGGNLLKFTGWILELIEEIGDRLFYSIDTL